jgi:large subunit ribosomal protein L15
VLRHLREPVKVLGGGELSRRLTVQVHKVSEGAKAKIETAGGKVESMAPAAAAATAQEAGG